jgi:hypothetical protein
VEDHALAELAPYRDHMGLAPGERIDLKRKVAATLGEQAWNEIDLTLEEFEFAVDDEWRGDDRSAYVLEMLRRGGSDESLVQLDAYLHPTAGPTASPQPESFEDPANPWSGNGLRLFLSHIHRNREQAGALREELARRSVDAFVAHDSIQPTEEWQDVILYALDSCDACLALLTPGFKESKWTDQEIGYCIARGLLVVPVELGLDPYGFIGRYQALSVGKGQTSADIALAVFELLVRKERSRDAMARALVSRWADTGSFDAARENYSFLKKIPSEGWTQQLVNDVWEAREREVDLREANIDWRPSEEALERLFANLPFSRPSRGRAPSDDDLPF